METKQPGIRLDYQPDEKQVEAIKRVYTRKIQMEGGTDYQEASKHWDKWRKQWEAYRNPKGEDDWQSNHVSPVTTAVVQAALSEMVDQTPQPIIIPRSKEDIPRSTVMKHIYNYTWEQGNGDLNLMDVMQESLICGTAIAQEYYFQQPRIIKHIKFEKNKETYEEEKIMEYDGVYMEPVKLEDFRVDETATSFDGPKGARDCIRRFIMNIDDAKLFFSGPFWNQFDNFKYVKAGGDTNYYEWYQPPQGIDKDKQVEVLWYWSRMPDDALIIVCNDVVLRSGPNPYRHKQLPFARLVDVKRTFRFYGKGEPELLESIQNEKDMLRRMTLDRNHLDIDKMFLVSDRAQLTEEDLVAAPHNMIPGGPDDVSPVEYNDMPRSIELSYNKLDEDGTIVTGIDPRFTSAPQAGTATEAAILKESALKRIRMKLRLLEREFLVRIARLRIANIIQFYSQPKLERIVGEDDTMQFNAQVEKLKAEGKLAVENGVPYQLKPREIRLEDRMLDFDTKGKIFEKPIKGFSFFELEPEYFVPVTTGGYDIRIAAGSTLPISKPLMQSKAGEMYDRLIQLALNGVGYDPVKLGDMLLEVNDYDPEDYHIEQEAETPDDSEEMNKQLIELAMEENKMLSNGQEIPATANASPSHTRIHIEFLKSPDSPKDPQLLQLFANHIVPEVMSIEQRGQSVEAGGMPEALAAGGDSNVTSQTAFQTGESQRKAVSPGKTKIQDVLPSKITGMSTMGGMA